MFLISPSLTCIDHLCLVPRLSPVQVSEHGLGVGHLLPGLVPLGGQARHARLQAAVLDGQLRHHVRDALQDLATRHVQW